MKAAKIINYTLLACNFLFVLLTWGAEVGFPYTIRFGYDFGDLYFWFIIFAVFLTHVVLSYLIRNTDYRLVLSIAFLAAIHLVCITLHASIWRGSIQPWGRGEHGKTLFIKN